MSQVSPRTPLQANSGATGLTVTTPVVMFPAQQVVGPSASQTTLPAGSQALVNIGGDTRPLRIFLTDLALSNGSATASVVTILDGATVIAAYAIAASAGPITVDLTAPLKGSPNTAMSIQQSAAGTIVWTASGYAASSN